MMGFEPTTSTLARLRSTTELHPLFAILVPPFPVSRGSGAIILILQRDARLFLRKMCFMAKNLVCAVVEFQLRLRRIPA